MASTSAPGTVMAFTTSVIASSQLNSRTTASTARSESPQTSTVGSRPSPISDHVLRRNNAAPGATNQWALRPQVSTRRRRPRGPAGSSSPTTQRRTAGSTWRRRLTGRSAASPNVASHSINASNAGKLHGAGAVEPHLHGAVRPHGGAQRAAGLHRVENLQRLVGVLRLAHRRDVHRRTEVSARIAQPAVGVLEVVEQPDDRLVGLAVDLQDPLAEAVARQAAVELRSHGAPVEERACAVGQGRGDTACGAWHIGHHPTGGGTGRGAASGSPRQG